MDDLFTFHDPTPSGLRGRSGTTKPRIFSIGRMRPGALLAYDAAVVAVLLWLLLAWHREWWLVHELPPTLGGVLPLVVPWAGALGGVTISLVGLSRHWDDLEEHLRTRQRWNVWHLTHPLIGAVMGSFAVLIVVLFVGTIGAGQGTTALDLTLTPTGVATLGVIGFVIGYRDHVFQDLVKRVADVIVGAGTHEEEATSGTTTPPAAGPTTDRTTTTTRPTVVSETTDTAAGRRDTP